MSNRIIVDFINRVILSSIVILVLVAVIIYLNTGTGQQPNTTQSTTLLSNATQPITIQTIVVTTVMPTTTLIDTSYELPSEYIPNSGKYNLSFVSLSGSAPSIRPNGPGIEETAITTYSNEFPVTSPAVPLSVSSLVIVCNSTANATNLFNSYKSRLMNMSSTAPVNSTNSTNSTNSSNSSYVLQLPQVGDESFGYAIPIQITVQAPNNNYITANLFALQFTYDDVYARVSIIESISTVSSQLLTNVSKGMLATIQAA